MADNKIEISLEQRDWERLQRISKRNGEPMEKIAARFLAADLAKIFNKPQIDGRDMTPFEERYLTDAYSKHFFGK